MSNSQPGIWLILLTTALTINPVRATKKLVKVGKQDENG